MAADLSARAKGVVAVSALLIACSVSGCSGGSTLAAAEIEPQPGYDDMQLVGLLEDRGGCLVVVLSGGEVYVPAFPTGSVDISAEGEGEGVLVLIEGISFHLGDQVSLGGSGPPAPDLRMDVEMPEACDASLPVWIVSPGSAVKS